MYLTYLKKERQFIIQYIRYGPCVFVCVCVLQVHVADKPEGEQYFSWLKINYALIHAVLYVLKFVFVY